MDGEREKFEELYNQRHEVTRDYLLRNRDGDTYKSPILAEAYFYWQARASLPAQPSDVVDGQWACAGHGDDYEEGCDECTWVERCNEYERKIAALTTQQAQSGDVQKLVEAARVVTDNYYNTFRLDIRDLKQALTPFTQNK